MTLKELLGNPYGLAGKTREEGLLAQLDGLVAHHRDRCPAYRRILDTLYPNYIGCSSLSEVPFLPVRLFKMTKLVSVLDQDVIKVLTSSGTTSQQVSKVFLDRETAHLQTKAVVSIGQSFLGRQRLPMVIVDHANVIQDRSSFSARGAGILGFSTFGRDHFYLLDRTMRIDWNGFEAFLDRHQGERIFFFGFTFMVWRYFYEACASVERSMDLGESILIHGGGWKKLEEERTSNGDFKERLRARLGLRNVYNYYGMVEQVGSIFMECEDGFLHAPSFADILVRNMSTLEVAPPGDQGLVQVLSALPRSYPGHSLLTEDLGVILGEDDCRCGRKGKFFLIHGRVPAAELRGCSDTHAFEANIQ